MHTKENGRVDVKRGRIRRSQDVLESFSLGFRFITCAIQRESHRITSAVLSDDRLHKE